MEGEKGEEEQCSLREMALTRRLLSYEIWRLVVWYKFAELVAERAAYLLE
jgi:hypothetical protein